MDPVLVLASQSETRISMLRQSGLEIECIEPLVDESAVKASLLRDGLNGRDVCDALSELKSIKVSQKKPDHLVLGSDQVLEIDGQILSKPKDKQGLISTLRLLSGKTHRLYSGAVISVSGASIWRHISYADLTMHELSDEFILDYVSQHYEDVSTCVGGYKIEAEGIRLFQAVKGDYFTILGMPIIEILTYLTQRGDIKI